MRVAALAVVAFLAAGGVHGQPIRSVENAFPGVSFDNPVGVVLAPGQRDRAYVVEQGGGGGRARVLTLRSGDAEPTVFLDLNDQTQAGGEAGLLGLAFHPEYEQNGRVFVSYTAPPEPFEAGVRELVSRVSEFARSTDNPLQADPASERVLLEVDQPAGNHNGGKIAFGPDGTLYVALGDGGGGGDPFDNGQDVTTLLGALLRIDVDDVPEGEPYGIPEDNPFAPTDGPERDEIYAYGLRNPWKFSITSSGEIWLGDVGQGAWEEIDVIEAGGNYGWNEVEGPACFQPGCDLSAYEAPVFSYGRSEGQSITGGFVFEVTDTALSFHYLYGDFVSGRLWALDPGRTNATLLLGTVPDGAGGTRRPNISSIDPGPPAGPIGGEPLLVDYGGTIYKLEVAGDGPTAVSGSPRSPSLRIAGPNPFRDATAVEVGAPPGGPVRVAVYDALGREVGQLHDGPMPPTALRLSLDGRDLAPGVYVVRLATATASADLRLVRVR